MTSRIPEAGAQELRTDVDYGFDASATPPAKLRSQADELEARARALREKAAETEAAMRRIEAEHDRRAAEKTPVDRQDIRLVSGAAVPPDSSHTALKPTGQQQDYIVLSDAERAKGFVRPYRDAYIHDACGKVTVMSRQIAETYARDPFFYGGTFCSTCGTHLPIGETGEFCWYEMDGSIGPRVGT